MKFLLHKQKRIKDFPDGEAYYLAIFFLKNWMKMKEIGPRGGTSLVPLPPVKSANDIATNLWKLSPHGDLKSLLKGGGGGDRFNLFHFHAFSGKVRPNNRLVPQLMGWSPWLKNLPDTNLCVTLYTEIRFTRRGGVFTVQSTITTKPH